MVSSRYSISTESADGALTVTNTRSGALMHSLGDVGDRVQRMLSRDGVVDRRQDAIALRVERNFLVSEGVDEIAGEPLPAGDFRSLAARNRQPHTSARSPSSEGVGRGERPLSPGQCST